MTDALPLGHDDAVQNPPHHRDEIARRLRATRLALGLRPSELCQATGIGTSTYSQWEAGLRMPDVLQILPICERFGLTLDWIYRAQISGLAYDLAVKIQAELANDPTSESGGKPSSI